MNRISIVIFEKWNTAADGSGIDYSPGENIIIKNNMTLYAQWDSSSTSDPGYKVPNTGID